MKNKYLYLLAAALIGIGLLYYSLKDVDLETFLNSFSNINGKYVLVSISFIFLSSLIRTVCWCRLIGISFIENYKSIFKSIIIGHMGNSIMPFRAGEFLKIYSLSKMVGKSKSYYTALTVIERFLDFMLLILLLGFGFFVIKIPIQLKSSLFGIILVTGFCFISLVVFLNNEKLRARFLDGVKLVFNESVSRKAGSVFDQLSVAVKTVRNFRSMVVAFISIFFSWLSIIVAYAFALKAFHLSFSMDIALFLMLALNIGIILPTLPAALGIYQACTILVFSQYGLAKSVALGYSFFIQAVELIPISILGLIFFLNMGFVNIQRRQEKV